MYAIVEIAGQQFKIAQGQKIFVHRLSGIEGDEIKIDKVLLVDSNDVINVGSPILPNVLVNAKILCHVNGDKVLVFHKKRRKGYRKLNGHRQRFTQIQIESININ
jgi:large subunit ribosomal protein L21